MVGLLRFHGVDTDEAEIRRRLGDAVGISEIVRYAKAFGFGRGPIDQIGGGLSRRRCRALRCCATVAASPIQSIGSGYGPNVDGDR